MKEFIFIWSIENISYSWHKPREKIVSPVFAARPMEHSTWTLRLCPRGFDDSDYLSLFLRRESDSAPKHLAINFELSCISADTSLIHTRVIPETLNTFTKFQEHGFGDLRFLKRHEVFGQRKALYLPKDTLTLRCRMWIDEKDNEFEQCFGITHIIIEEIKLVKNIKPETSMHTLKIYSKSQNQVLISINISFFNDKLDIGIYPMNPKLMNYTTLNLSVVDKITARILCEHEIVWLDMPRNEVFRLPFSGTLQNDNSEGSNFEFISKLVYSTGREMEETYRGEYHRKVPEFLTNYIFSCVPSGKLTDYPSLSKDIWNLYKEQILWDVKLKIKDTTLLAHKVVLCARSSVFLAMLTGEMKEKENGCIEIEDISANTMEKFLIYLYTDDFKDLEWDAVAELYYAADKYQVEQLRLLCSFHLMKTIGVDNVCKLLMLADQHNDCELRRALNDFIWKNDETVFKSSAWKEFAETEPVLALRSMLWKYGEKENQQTIKICDKIPSHGRFLLLDDLRSLYKSRIASDIVIKTKSSTFPVHKGILCASSSTFKDMLLNDLREKSTDFIEIDDLEDETISEMLFFLYTDLFGNISRDTFLKLYRASSKYQIYRLKFQCSRSLLSSLRLSNVCELLLLAHEHSDEHLKSAVEDYILAYDKEVFTSDEWNKLTEANIFLANETMHAKYKKVKETTIRNT